MSRKLQGKLSLSELAAEVDNGAIETVLVVFPDMYGRLLGKRLAATFFLDHAAEGGTHVCDYLLACDIEMDPVPGYTFTSWEKGYGDMHAVADVSTLRRAAWLPGTAIVICDLFMPDHSAAAPAPRRILQRQLERATSLGFNINIGTELEFYIFDESYASARDKGYRDLKTTASYIEDYHILQGTREEPVLSAIRRELAKSAVSVEGTKGEWGPGQQELNLIYSSALDQADQVVICRHASKEIADAQGKAITYMAKWDSTLAGSGMHMHVSLWDLDGESAFNGPIKLGSASVSDTFRHFLAGALAYALDSTAFYAPNVSSYKRFQASSFAPTGIAWSDDNRTAGFRVVGTGKSLRIECRIPGADANPYLAYAAFIAAGLEGIEKQLEPPPPFAGDIYQAASMPRLQTSLRDAVASFDQSEFARSSFGSDVVDHYIHFFKTEQRKFDEIVTDWEKARFFERI